MNRPAIESELASAASESGLPRTVLHVLNAASGGAALSTLALVREFARRGIRSCAVCHDMGEAQDRAALAEAVEGRILLTPLYWSNRKIRSAIWKRPLLEVRQWLKTGCTLASTKKVVEFARAHRTDLIHTNTIVTPEGGFAARKLGLPHVWHLRELVGPGTPCRLPWEGAAFRRRVERFASVVVANSEASAACVRGWLTPEWLKVVPNGLDIDRFQAASHQGRQGPLVVAMVGNLTSRVKKHGLFIDAAASVDPALPIEFRIYGADPSNGGRVRGDRYIDELHERVRRHDMNGRLRFAGYQADPVAVMSQIDILVHPADGESFGRVLVEAMAAGIPVVGAKGGGAAEIIADGSTGLLAMPDDPRQLAQCVECLARDPELRARMGAAGRQRAALRYSLQSCVAGVLRAYQHAMRRPVGRAILERN